jgi:hypothetical protein
MVTTESARRKEASRAKKGQQGVGTSEKRAQSQYRVHIYNTAHNRQHTPESRAQRNIADNSQQSRGRRKEEQIADTKVGGRESKKQIANSKAEGGERITPR